MKPTSDIAPSLATTTASAAASTQNPTTPPATAPRCAAIVGPYGSGKTSLLESLLFASGTIHKKGSVRDGTATGDSDPDARSRQMSTEPTITRCRYLDEDWHFIDCPGSIEFAQDMRDVAMICDVAIVVVEPDPERVVMAAPFLKFLDHNRIPHVIFINKTDHGGVHLRDMLPALQGVSERPLVLREIPLRAGQPGEDAITGFVDVVSQRAYEYLQGQPSRLISMPARDASGDLDARNNAVRDGLLEALADFDDALLEQLLEDQAPAPETIWQNLQRDLAADLIVPVFFGAAEQDHGIIRLLKALRHEAPSIDVCRQRLGIDPDNTPFALQIFKTLHLPHAGRFCIGRILAGQLHASDSIGADKAAGICTIHGDRHNRCDSAQSGEIIGLARIEHLRTGMLCLPGGPVDGLTPDPLPPLYSLAIEAAKPGDDVKLADALRQLCEQDRSLGLHHDAQSGQLVLSGQGDIQLQTALSRLAQRYHLDVHPRPVQTPYQETIRKPAGARGRYKKQSGGHGQFGDAEITLAPLPRGEGFRFSEQIVGGAIPRQYIPAVEKGIRDGMRTGPLGFAVTDIAITLTDGSFHAVDSSDQAFQMAGRLAIADALKAGQPVLLEPVNCYAIVIPAEFTSRAQRLVTTRRGQILGFSAHENWPGWDRIDAFIPMDDSRDLIMELRSLTQGTGFFTSRFAHMQELAGKQADQVIAARHDILNRAS